MATLDCGTCNFGGDEIFVNTENMIIDFANTMNEYGIKPEIEVFDKGMVDMAIRLHKKGYIKAPMHFDFVMGVNGACIPENQEICFLWQTVFRQVPTVDCIRCRQFAYPMVTMGIPHGRTCNSSGFEI